MASYIGTIGMAHRVETIFEAARLCDDPDIVFMVVGTGARREELEALQREHQLENFRLVDKVPRETVPYLLRISDASIVHLRDSPLFETVIPSKIFEAMAASTPIVLGVRGETRSIIEEAGGGIAIPPEDPREMVQAVRRLKCNPETHAQMSENAYRHVRTHYDRELLAREYADTLRAAAE